MNTRFSRISSEFDDEIKKIIRERVKIGKDDALKPKSVRRITRAIVKHNEWERLKREIINAELPERIGESEWN